MSVDKIDIDILKFMSVRENYEIYEDTITSNLCTKESWRLVQDFGRYYKEYPELTEIDKDFILWFRVSAHPGWKPEEHQLYGKIINNVLEAEAPIRGVFLDQLDRTRQIEYIGKALKDLRSGSLTLNEFHTKLSGFQTGAETIRESNIQTFTLEDVAKSHRSNAGLFWRLEDLNRSIGPLHKGDFIVVAKRPEVGGTSFLISEMSHMLEQMEGNAVIFNNEEEPSKVYTRMVSGALGVDYRTMMSAEKLHQQQYDKWLNGSDWDLVHDTNMTIAKIHQYLKEKEYGLIGINVLLKVAGTGAKEDHDHLQALGVECRRIAQLYGPVIAIVQADPSAEGMRYIPQDRIYKSKTALQGEADAQIMIGRDDDVPDTSRFIYVAKNKIPPAPCTDLSNKHIKTEVEFDMGTGRFISTMFRKHSRGN